MLEKLIHKYEERLLTLKCNFRENGKGDDYPYAFDIKNHNEIIRDLKKLLKR